MTQLATNPKAYHDYEILETLEAGLVLTGHEVKSIRKGQASIKGSYVRIINNQAYLVGAIIPPYQPGNTPIDYAEQHDRKLLISRSQLTSLVGLAKSHGVALVPLKIIAKKRVIKLEIGVARGKKKYDKRESIKNKDIKRAKERGTHDA